MGKILSNIGNLGELQWNMERKICIVVTLNDGIVSENYNLMVILR